MDRFSNGSCHTGENFKSIYDASLSYSIQVSYIDNSSCKVVYIVQIYQLIFLIELS